MSGDVEPCRRLMAAVLIQAVNDAHGMGAGHSDQRRRHRNDRVRRDARQWIASDATGPNTFIWFCELLGLAPEPLRAGALYGPRRRREQVA